MIYQTLNNLYQLVIFYFTIIHLSLNKKLYVKMFTSYYNYFILLSLTYIVNLLVKSKDSCTQTEIRKEVIILKINF